MALSGNKLLGLLEDSGYKVQTVKTNKSTNNSNNTSTNNNPARGAANRGGSNSGTTSTTVKTDSSEKKKNNSSSKSDIAPVRTTTSSTSSKDEENKWFQKGAFEDGYQFGDVLRTILGTAGDVGVGLVKGATSLVGGLADAATVGIAKVADAFGDEELARNMRNAQSSATTIDNAFAPVDSYLDRYSVLGDKSDNIAEGLGQVGSVILTGGIAGALGATAVGATALTTGLMGASSFGSGMREALNSGASEKEASTYGLIKGVVDAGSEMIFGGLGKSVKALGISRGLSSLDDMFAKSLSSKITNQVAKNFVQFGVKASAEGVEEVLAGFGSAVGKKLTYMSDEDLKTLVKDENLLEQFVAGAVTSGFAQSGLVPGMRAGSLAEANKSRTDFVTGHSVNEQKVIDKEVENRIAEAEKDGKVTNKQKNEIYEEVIRDMERGYISTDTIEEVLGGETYKTHSDTIAREKALQDEYDKLYKMKNGEKSDEQIDRQADLKKQLEDIEKNFNRNQLRDEVMSLVQNDRLSESYYERSRRGQNFTADVSKYDAKQQETIQKAIDSGILNNTNRTHEFVDMISKITADKGVSFDFTNNQKLKESGFAVEGKTVNGYVDGNHVTLNVNSAKALNKVVGHEITHVLEGTELYDVLSETITEYARNKGDYDKRLAVLTELYKNVEDADVNAELVADLVGDYLFTDADFVRNLSATDKNVFQKIFDEIKYLCKVATAGSKEARQLEKVKKAFEDAYKTDSKTQTETKYSLSETSDGRFVAVVDNDILSNIDTSSWDDTKKAAAKKAAVDALKQFSNGIVVDGVTRKVNRTSRREYTRSNYTESLYNKAPDFFADKMRAADIADDIVVAATDWSRDGGLKHPRTDDFVDFDHGNTLILSGDAKYSAEVIVGITKTGEAVLYDVVDLKPADFDAKKEEVPTTATTQNAIGDIQGTSLKVGQSGKSDTSLLGDNIAPSKPGVNPKAGNNTQSGKFSLSANESNVNSEYALSDSEGRKLNPVVQKRFSNSKVVDENGSLKVVYHGTATGEFSIFDKSKGSVEGDFGSGFYFTDNQADVSEHYEGGGPDFENKVARLAEQIEVEEDIDYEEAEEKAREQLYKGSHLFEVYLNIENPAIVGETMLLNGESYMEQYNEEDFEDYDEYLEEVEQLVSDDIEKIVWEVERNVDLYSTDGIAEILWEAYSEGGMDIEDLKKRLNDLYLEDNNGNLVANEVARQIIESLGYDGIIDPTVSGKWNMDIEEGTKHYIVFKPNQIKAVSNQNPTDNPDIHRSLSGLNEDIAPIGNYNVYGSDVALDDAPVPEYGDVLANEARMNTDDDFAPVRGGTQGTGRQRPRNPILDKKTSKGWSAFKDNIIDRGTVFETMSIKSGNRELDAKFRAINRAATSSQYFMKNGSTNAKSLDSIRSAVEKSGKTKRFEKYLYHMHNVDRMNVNKPVFGSHVTAEQSAAEAARLEKANPEFKQWAEDVYSYMGELREMMVENGMITPETRDLWIEMYPHYVPIRRNGEDMPGFMPTDDQNIAVNAPIKRATGGSSEILPLFDTMAMRTEQTFKAVAKNKFGVELMHELGGSPVGVRDVGIDESIDSVSFEQLQRGMPGRNPTMTVYENGESVTFEITEEMYNTMQPKSDFMASEFKPASKASELKRKLITEYNPSFALRNPIKDAQDVLFNSQHAAKTYANFPKAAFELLNKNGQYYQEYMENGGESVSYFNEDTQTFAKEKSGISKVIGFPLEAISKVNNFIERVPRMAEYIASRESGRSIDVSMLDAARVTTDFSAGGDLTKFLNRNGFTFLNSSVQGAVQNVRNIREAKAEGLKGWAKLAAKVMVAGLPEMVLNNLLWEDDEEYEELSDYIKQRYYVVAKYGDGTFIRIPKGRVASVISNAFSQMQDKITGNDEFDFDTFADLVIENLAPNNPLDNNILAPFIQAAQNRAWYGDEILPERLEDLPVDEQFDETTDSLSKWLSEKAGDIGFDISPYKLNYVLENTTGILGDYFLPMMTPAAERGDDSFLGNLLAPIKDDFTADSVLKNQNISDYYDTAEELEKMANSKDASVEDMFASKFMDSVGYEMADLYAKKREIQNSDMSDSEKYKAVREIQKQIVALAKKGLASYNDISVSGKYAEVADKRYNFDAEDDKWYEIQEGNYYSDQEQKVTKNLGISYEEYWNNRDLYDDANHFFEYKPDMLDVAKTVFGIEKFATYAAEMSQLKGDDLNGDGQADPYTKQNKIFAYIDSLDIPDIEKEILRKMNYPKQSRSNSKIIEYLNNRTDLSYDDRVNALTGLGFKVADDGRITNYGSGSGYGGGGTSYNSGKQQKAIERYGITAAEYQADPDLYKKADYYFDNKYLDDDLDLEFVAKTVFGLDEFVHYAAELSQIRGDDLDGDGKSDSGTKKKKIFAYIDSLDIPDIEKEILRKMSYRYEKRSNTRIINYLKNREDISDDDRLRVLRGLGFKVFDDGRISW